MAELFFQKVGLNLARLIGLDSGINKARKAESATQAASATYPIKKEWVVSRRDPISQGPVRPPRFPTRPMTANPNPAAPFGRIWVGIAHNGANFAKPAAVVIVIKRI